MNNILKSTAAGLLGVALVVYSLFWQSGYLFWILIVCGGLFLVWAIYLALRGENPEPVPYYAPRQVAAVTPDIQKLSQDISTLINRVNALATTVKVNEAQTFISGKITTLEATLLNKIAEAAVAALSKSELGELRQKLSIALMDLEEKKKDLGVKATELTTAIDVSKNAEKALGIAEGEQMALKERFSEIEGKVNRLTTDLEASQDLVKSTEVEVANQKAAADVLRAEAEKGYEVLAPAKLKDTDLGVQVHAMYLESLSGNAASIAAWTTLTVFVSAQTDPMAKDFQLQIVRRLGLTLVNYWKQQGHAEKERHEKLVHWAKSLNELADSRYNLLVPSLGEPIDRSRMSCATSVTAIREVLCWQVRNPAGANFSLAEVA
jgi:hypothetical protein